MTFGLIALTLPVNIVVVILETRAGRRLNSEILLADAKHTRTDLFVTATVIGSVIGVWLGWYWLDFFIAGVVVILIIRASVGILRSSIGTLADVAGVDPKRVEQAALNVPGVRSVHKVRSRGVKDAIFVDLHTLVDPAMSTSQAHSVASEVERQVYMIGDNIVDAIVHIEPDHIQDAGDWERISYGLRQISEGMGLSLHDLNVHVNPNGEYSIDLDLEIRADVTLKQAHDLADEFERRALVYCPGAASINTHLEPAKQNVVFSKESGDLSLDESIKEYITSQFKPIGQTEVISTIVEDRINISLQYPLRGDISLIEAHEIVEEIKRAILNQYPQINRVIIHVEPENVGDNSTLINNSD
jgi:divalent metal cation (Fe/Co/Zn/Cd) transporter